MNLDEILKRLPKPIWDVEKPAIEPFATDLTLPIVKPLRKLPVLFEADQILEVVRNRLDQKLIVVQPPSQPIKAIQRSPNSHRIMVRRQTVPYWKERGWSAKGEKYQGYYRTKFGSWKGRSDVGLLGHARMFIQNPPSFLSHHPHWSCFLERPDGWFHVHVHNRFTLSEGILRVEEILTEASGMQRL
jgi:hypothetical protein